jgi:hypothetical protein
LTRVKKTRANPYLDLRPLDQGDTRVRGRFSGSEFPYLYVAEAFAPCGCGFPEDLRAGKERRMKTEEGKTMARLAECLRPAVRGRPRVQLLLCFLGDEETKASLGRTVTLGDLEDPSFRFRNLEVVTVVRGAVEQ